MLAPNTLRCVLWYVPSVVERAGGPQGIFPPRRPLRCLRLRVLARAVKELWHASDLVLLI